MNKKDYPITIGDKTYNLRFNYSALTWIEDQTSKAYVALYDQILKGHMGACITLLLAGLRKNHPDVTAEELTAVLDEFDMSELTKLFREVILATTSFFKQKDKTPAVAGDDSKKKTDSVTPMEESIGAS